MKNPLFFTTLAMVLLCIVSCKKDTTEDPAKEKTCLISGITHANPGAPQTLYTYDEQGRIIEYRTLDNTLFRINYSGLSGEITMTDLSGNVLDEMNVTFDSQGRLTSFENYNIFSGNTLRYFYQFTYNSEGYLITNVQTLKGGSYDVYYMDSLAYENGNLVKKTVKDKEGRIYETTDYTYKNELNKSWNFFFDYHGEPFSILSGYPFLYPLLGKNVKNLPASITITERDFTNNVSFDYLTDEKGYVKEFTKHIRNSYENSSNNFKISYECQ